MNQATKIGLIAGGAVAAIILVIVGLRYIGSSQLPTLPGFSKTSGQSTSAKEEYSPPSNFSNGYVPTELIVPTSTSPIAAPPSLPDTLR